MMRNVMPAVSATILFACGPQAPPEAAVKTGAQVLFEREFDAFAGHRVGLIVNHTARIGERHLISLAHEADSVTIGALFGPEHGLRGTEEDGVAITDGRDGETGAPVYSLYGATRRPTLEMLRGIDLLVYDIQDVGARFYTFISTMGLAMQSAAEAGIPFLVLDRPNPLGGAYVSGFVLSPEHASFVGQYAIPITHGMTTGELAQMIKGEALLPGLEDLELAIAPMEGWRRSMQWPDTGLPWVNTSPNIPDFSTALIYPGACFFEATSASEGRGTRTPFMLLGAPWADGPVLAQALNARALPGVLFEAASFTPQPLDGMDTNPKLEGLELGGVRYQITDRHAVQPVEAGIHALHAFYHMAPNPDAFLSRPAWLARLSGTTRLLQMLEAGDEPEAITVSWAEEVEVFRARRAAYLLYP